MGDSNSDQAKKIFGKSAKEIFSATNEQHATFHSSNAFCGNAGPEEMKHFQDLLDKLSDSQIVTLVNEVGIRFDSPVEDIDRGNLEGVLDEASREDFYREYRRLTQ